MPRRCAAWLRCRCDTTRSRRLRPGPLLDQVPASGRRTIPAAPAVAIDDRQSWLSLLSTREPSRLTKFVLLLFPSASFAESLSNPRSTSQPGVLARDRLKFVELTCAPGTPRHTRGASRCTKCVPGFIASRRGTKRHDHKC